MEKFKKIIGIAAPFTRINVDTDLIIPAENLKTISRQGLGKYLFSYIRFNEDGSENKKFILNQPHYKNSGILVTGKNFGCGSSREHAVWALKDFGIKYHKLFITKPSADIYIDDKAYGYNISWIKKPNKNHTQWVPGHPGGTNLDEKDMTDRFQALPGVKISLKNQKMKGLRVK